MASSKRGTLYIGVTSYLTARTHQHRESLIEGFTKRYGLHRLVHYELHETMESTIHREKRLKKYRRAAKIALIEKMNPAWDDLWHKIIG